MIVDFLSMARKELERTAHLFAGTCADDFDRDIAPGLSSSRTVAGGPNMLYAISRIRTSSPTSSRNVSPRAEGSSPGEQLDRLFYHREVPDNAGIILRNRAATGDLFREKRDDRPL